MAAKRFGEKMQPASLPAAVDHQMRITMQNDGPNRMIVCAVNVAAPASEPLQVLMKKEVPGGGGCCDLVLVPGIGFLVALGSDA